MARGRSGQMFLANVDLCPDKDRHTIGPDPQEAWNAWVAEMRKTHDQSMCPSCGYWAIWTPKEDTP